MLLKVPVIKMIHLRMRPFLASLMRESKGTFISLRRFFLLILSRDKTDSTISCSAWL